MLQNIQKDKADIPKQIQEEKQKTEILEKVSGINSESIVKNISSLKTNLSNSLDEMLQSLSGEFKKLEEIRAAIVQEKKTLEDLYSLSANTDSLAAMLLAQKEKKENFEKTMKEAENAFTSEMAETKAQWEREKAKQKADEKEYADDLSKQRKREEEEYAYNQKIKRKKNKMNMMRVNSNSTRNLPIKKQILNRKYRIAKQN